MKYSNNCFSLLPDFVLNVGITGHRNLPDNTIGLIEKSIMDVLEFIKHDYNKIYDKSSEFYSGKPPLYRFISPLAEGADRIAAAAALKCGYTLQCPLPFGKAEYEKDFESPVSKEVFRQLLGRAESVYEIEVNSKIRSKSYLNIGEVILTHSDVLISVWNGAGSEYIGGTSDITHKAVEQNIPVIWINSVRPGEIKILYNEMEDSDWKVILSNVLESILIPEKEDGIFPFVFDAETSFGKNKYFFLKKYFFLHRWLIKMIVKLSPKKKNPAQSAAAPRGVDSKTSLYCLNDKHFKIPYEHIDSSAIYYAEHFRTAGLLRQALPLLAAVGLSIGFYWGLVSVKGTINVIGFLLQALFLWLIVFVTRINRERKWHHKFTDYRLLAELLRQMVYLYPLGTVIRNTSSPLYEDKNNSNWINWYYRATVRQAGLPNIKIDQESLCECREILKNIVTDQINYQTAAAVKHGTVAKFLESNGVLFYNIGLVATLIRVGIFQYDIKQKLIFHGKEVSLFFNMLSMIIPAFATAFFGIAAQGNYQRLERRSSAMANQLSRLSNKLNRLNELSYDTLKHIAEETAFVMISEVMDWNILIKSKGVNKY